MIGRSLSVFVIVNVGGGGDATDGFEAHEDTINRHVEAKRLILRATAEPMAAVETRDERVISVDRDVEPGTALPCNTLFFCAAAAAAAAFSSGRDRRDVDAKDTIAFARCPREQRAAARRDRCPSAVRRQVDGVDDDVGEQTSLACLC